MVDLVHKGATWLAQRLRDFAAREVEYRRGDQVVLLKATIGRTRYEQLDAQGIVTSYESRDFLIRTAELVLGGNPTLPLPSDQIVEGGSPFIVLPLPNEECFRYSDPHRVLLRIHTKEA